MQWPILFFSLILVATASGQPSPDVHDGSEFSAELPATDHQPLIKKVTYLGVIAKPVDDSLRDQLNLPDGTGLIVMTVDSDGPAAADLHVNDVLQKLDDQILIDAHQLVTLIHLHHPGDTVTLTAIRGSKPVEVKIKLGEKEQHLVTPGKFPEVIDLPGVKMPDEFSPNLSFATLSFSDGTYSANVATDNEGHRKMTVKNTAGKVVAEGLVDTQEQWKDFTPDIRKHMAMMQKMLFPIRK